jgi:hypothetical protein
VRLTEQGEALLTQLASAHQREIRLLAPRLVAALRAANAIATDDSNRGAEK